MINIERLCHNCMRELPSEGTVCPHCGYHNRTLPPRPDAALPEQTILRGRYLLGPVLGQGGFGITYLAVDLQDQKRVAIKEYFPVGLVTRIVTSGPESAHESAGSDSGKRSFTDDIQIGSGEQERHFINGKRRFQREAATLMELNRLDGVVNVFDFFEENGTAYMVMEYIPGISLKEYMSEQRKKTGKPFSWETSLRLIEPVMAALAEVHRAGIVHRDISPDNILISGDGNERSAENGDNIKVTLIDFGASKEELAAVFNKSTTILVKHGYAPEEQYRTHGLQGAWTDIYALCGTIYHMISGEVPVDAIERIIQDTLPALKELDLDPPVPAEVSDVVEKGMKIRAKERYQSIEEMRADLSRAVAAEKARRAEERRKEKERLAAEEETRREEARRRKEKERLDAEEETHREEENRTQKQDGTQKKGWMKKAWLPAAAVLLLLLLILVKRGTVKPASDHTASDLSANSATGEIAETETAKETVKETEAAENAGKESSSGRNALFDPAVYKGEQDCYRGVMMSKEEAAAVPFQFNSKYAGTSYYDGRSLSELGTRDEDYWIEESMDHSGESLFFSDIMHFSETGELETGTAWNYDSVLPYMTQRWEYQTQAETEGYSSYLYSVTPNRYTASATANIMYHNKPSGESDNGYHRVLVKAGEGQTDLCGYEADGVMAIQAAFSDAGWFSEGLAAVKREGAGWGYIDEKGAVRIPFGLQSAGPFVNGLAPVSFKDGSETVHCGYIDRDGKLVYLLADELSSKITEACRWREYLCLGPADEKGEFYIGYRSFRTGDVNSVNEAWGGIDGIAKNMDSSEEILSWLEEYVASVMQDAIERDVAFSGFLFKVKADSVVSYDEKECWNIDLQIPGENGTVTLLRHAEELQKLWKDYIVTEEYVGPGWTITSWIGWSDDTTYDQDADGNYIYHTESALWTNRCIQAVDNTRVTIGVPDVSGKIKPSCDVILYDWNKKLGRMRMEVVDEKSYKIIAAGSQK